MEDEYKVVCALSNIAAFDDLIDVKNINLQIKNI